MDDLERRHGISDEDIARIIDAVQYRHPDVCRFDTIERTDLEEAVRFYRNFNTMMEDSKKTIRNTLLGILCVLVIGLMTEGIWSKILAKLK